MSRTRITGRTSPQYHVPQLRLGLRYLHERLHRHAGFFVWNRSQGARRPQVGPVTTGYDSRYQNHVNNVIGESGYATTYESDSAFFGTRYIWDLGFGNPNTRCPSGCAWAGCDASVATCGPDGEPATDPLAAATTLRWANWDAVRASPQYNDAEVPADNLGLPSQCGSGQSCPASFYLVARPSWWTRGMPWPAIGSDITGGNVGQCGGDMGESGNAQTAFAGLPALSSTQCASGQSLSSGAWAGHVYANPAMAYYFDLGGLPDGTGPILNFDATHYASSGYVAPNAPTGLTAIAR